MERFLPALMEEVSDTSHIDFEGLNDPMAQTVIPNLLRVGLVPERHVDGYLAQGWKVDLERGTIVDLHTFHAETRAKRKEFAERGIDFADSKQL